MEKFFLGQGEPERVHDALRIWNVRLLSRILELTNIGREMGVHAA